MGSLRGGTHSHAWSGDGKLLSFTYNDEFMDPDIRVVGVMIPSENTVEVTKNDSNNSGSYYSAIVSEVRREPLPSSDEINNAFDECWVGNNGYINSAGRYIQYALAFQGNTLNEEGRSITEIFVVEINEKIILDDKTGVGKEGERPHVPQGITQRRLSYTKEGLSNLRHWLRSSPDGEFIYALAKDKKKQNQIVRCHVNTEIFEFITELDFSISSPINISYNGDKIAFVAANNIYIFDLLHNILSKLTDYDSDKDKIVGAPVFSRDDTVIAFNQYLTTGLKRYVQIRIIDIVNK